MAQINFPVATADGQTFEAPNGVIYTYVGTPPNGYWSGTFQDQSLQTLDGRYLKLDASNDPLTSSLTIASGDSRLNLIDTDTGATGQLNGNSAGGNLGINVDIDSVYSADNESSLIVFNRGTENFRVRGDGKVTVGGNPNPAAMFDVKGDIMVGAAGIEGGQITLRGVDGSKTVSFWDVYRDDQIRFFTNQDDVKFSIGSYSSGGEIALRTNNQERLYVTSDGNVGIGETNPERQLHVNGGSNVNNILVESTNNSSYITFQDANTTTPSSVRVGSSADQLRILTGGTDSMRIDENGNVGIGTTSPSSKLNVHAGNLVNGDNDYSSKVGATLEVNRAAGSNNDINNDTGMGAILEFRHDVNRYVSVESVSEARQSSKIGLRFTTMDAVNVTDESMRLTSNGNLKLTQANAGIYFNGDTAYANKLDDYEEGSWTPTLIGSTSAGTVTYQRRSATYTKVGNVVTIQCNVQWDNGSGGTGVLRITGLPFVSKTGVPTTNKNFAAGYASNIQTMRDDSVVYAYLPNNASYLQLDNYVAKQLLQPHPGPTVVHLELICLISQMPSYCRQPA